MSRRLCAFTFVLVRGDRPHTNSTACQRVLACPGPGGSGGCWQSPRESREATFYAHDEAAARGYARTWAAPRGWVVEGSS